MDDDSYAWMEAGNGRRTLTVNQIVAFNVRRARQLRGWSQEEFAQRMQGYSDRSWSVPTVSAAERSFESGRVRRFDANEIVALAMVCRLPIVYFFIPPTNEEIEKHQLFHWFATFEEQPGQPFSQSVMFPPEYRDTIEPFDPVPEFHERMQTYLEEHGIEWTPPTLTQHLKLPKGMSAEIARRIGELDHEVTINELMEIAHEVTDDFQRRQSDGTNA